MWDMVYKALLFEIDEMWPSILVKVRKHRPVWFSSALSEISRERDILFERYRRGGRKNKDLYVQERNLPRW